MKRTFALALALVAATAFGQDAPSIDQMLQPNAGPSASQGVIGVVLDANGKDQKLSPTPGTMNTVYAFVTVLIYSDFGNLHAQATTDAATPTVYVLMGGEPGGRVFLVRTKVNPDTHNRSLKMGKAKFAGYAGVTIPDPDWSIPYDAKQIKPGEWAITPKVPLKPGEYGLFVPATTPNASGVYAAGGSLYGFGVESSAPAVATGAP